MTQDENEKTQAAADAGEKLYKFIMNVLSEEHVADTFEAAFKKRLAHAADEYAKSVSAAGERTR